MAVAGQQHLEIAGVMVVAPVAPADWLVIAPVVLPMLVGAALLMLRRRLALQVWAANLALLANVAICASLALHIINNGPVTMTMGRWLPPFGISFSADMTGAIMVLTASLVALSCGVFSVGDIDLQRRRYGFYTFFLLMIAGVNGAFLTGDVFNLYVWFEVLLIASFGLIVIGSEPRQLDGSLKYAFLNLIATTLFLIATGYLYGVFGSLNMADIAVRAAAAPPAAPLVTIAVLYLMAFAMKAAAFPLNFWLPASYHTPRIVVSALFAALLTKVGVYALMRILVMVLAGQMEVLAPLIAAVAITTMLVGVFGALAQSDLSRLMGYLVISGIGTMMAGVALPGEFGLSGAITYAVHSMVITAALYLATGIIGQKSGDFDLRRLGGHYAASSWFGSTFLILALAVAGLPPLSGFWPKLLVVKGAIFSGQWLVAAAVLVTALLTSLAIMRVWLFAFWRGGPEGTRDGAEAWLIDPLPSRTALALCAPVATLTVLSVLIGLYPGPLLTIAGEAARGLADPALYIESVFGATR
jgi:multicomponent Na+:H+ antiporter subunit D